MSGRSAGRYWISRSAGITSTDEGCPAQPQSNAALHQAVNCFRARLAGRDGLINGFALLFIAIFRGFLAFCPLSNPPGDEGGQSGGKGEGGGDHAAWELPPGFVLPAVGGGVIRCSLIDVARSRTKASARKAIDRSN